MKGSRSHFRVRDSNYPPIVDSIVRKTPEKSFLEVRKSFEKEEEEACLLFVIQLSEIESSVACYSVTYLVLAPVQPEEF